MTAMTKHACVRQQQRAIPPLIIEWLMEYGTVVHDGHGAMIYYFSKQSRKRLQKAAGKAVVSRLSDLLDSYAIANDETIITVGRRHKAIPK